MLVMLWQSLLGDDPLAHLGISPAFPTLALRLPPVGLPLLVLLALNSQ